MTSSDANSTRKPNSLYKLDRILEWYRETKAYRDAKEVTLFNLRQQKEAHESKLYRLKESRAIVQIVAQKTQEKLEFRISKMVSTALAAVYDDPEEFQIEFRQFRNRTECWPWLVNPKTGHKRTPAFSAGGGALDIASFALRCAIWSIKKTRPCLILDEPFKYVSLGLQNKCSEMVKRLTDKLNLQVIMISHLPRINIAADRNIKITKEGLYSECSEDE